jgi:hypothetical protein
VANKTSGVMAMPQCDNRAVLHLIDKALRSEGDAYLSDFVRGEVLGILRKAIVDGKMDITLKEPLDDVA